MGERGPVPKRSSQRRRRNKSEPVDEAAGADQVEQPPAGDDWHPVAVQWYDALARSGQSAFYEPSDWATAYMVAESMSRELRPRPVATKDGEAVMATLPISGSSMAALLKAMGSLLTTEGDRRRARLELQRRQTASDDDGPADVSELAEYRRRAQQG